MLSEISQAQKTMYCLVPLISRKGDCLEIQRISLSDGVLCNYFEAMVGPINFLTIYQIVHLKWMYKIESEL